MTRKILLPLAAVLVSLLLARIHPFGDAGLFSTAQPAQLSATFPPEVRAILTNSCADCHAAPTHVRLYARFAPISWLLERDIVEARKHLNLAQWDSYTPDQQQAFQSKMLLEAKSHEMPPLQYRLAHWDTTLSPAQLETLAIWAHASPSQPAGAHALLPGDPARGQQVFEKRCTGCHSLDQSHEGPQLRGVYGHTAAAVIGFHYSSAIKQAHITWTDTTLNQWLTDPDSFVPGTDMDFRVPRPQERADLIRFLKQASAN